MWQAWVIMRVRDGQRKRKNILQSSGSRNDLNELLSDDGLAGSVEGHGQLFNDLS